MLLKGGIDIKHLLSVFCLHNNLEEDIPGEQKAMWNLIEIFAVSAEV